MSDRKRSTMRNMMKKKIHTGIKICSQPRKFPLKRRGEGEDGVLEKRGVEEGKRGREGKRRRKALHSQTMVHILRQVSSACESA